MTPLPAASLTLIFVFAGLFGLVIGSFLNVVIYRVPAGISLLRESRCPSCEAPVKPWQNVPVISWLVLRGRCASCGAPISGRYPLVELATGVAFVGVLWLSVDTEAFRLASLAQRPDGSFAEQPEAWPVLIAYLYLAAISIALALIDLDTRRLPNAIVLPGYVVLSVLFTTACLVGTSWESLLRATIGGASLYAFYFLLSVLRPGGMGGGDVKLAGVLGLALGWIGWGTLIVGAFAAFVVGGIVGVALMLAGRAGRKTAIPFGPWMIVGAWIGILAGEQISDWYLGLLGAS